MKMILIGVAISVYASSFGQAIKGTIKDSTGLGIPNASINLRSQGVIVAYTATDTGGAYTLHPPAGLAPNDLALEVRCIGYKEQTIPVRALPATIDCTLAMSASELAPLVIRDNRPVLHSHGDTLDYKVTDFRSVQDRVIGDVIKRLPGISVASDGTIYYNGRAISGVYIGGDNLLDDNYGIATTSVPADKVDKVQVIDNIQPIKVLQNKVNTNDVALNLVMNKTARLHVMGQESIGAGLPGNYDADLKAMAFKNDYKAINYLEGNNTGYDLRQELVSHNASAGQQRLGADIPTPLLSLGAANDPALSRQRYLFDRSGMLTANDLVDLRHDWQLRLNAWNLQDRERQDYSQVTSIYLPGDTVRYAGTQHNQLNPGWLRAQFTATLNSSTCYLNNVTLVNDNRWTDYSHVNTNGSPMDQALRDNALGFSNEFNWMRTVQSDHIIQAYSYVSRMTEPETRSIGPSYNDSLFNHGAPYAQLIQTVDVPTWYTNDYVSFKVPGDVMTRSFRAGFSEQSQMLTSNLNAAFDSAANNLSWEKKKAYAEAAFDIVGQKLRATLTLPFTYQQLHYADPGYALDRTLTRCYFNPELIGKYKVGPENFVTFRYGYRNQTGSIEDVYQGYLLKDYRTLSANSPDLTLRRNQEAATGYYYRKAMRLFFWSLNLAYNRIGANNIASDIITDSYQRLVMLPFRNHTDSWTVDGTISKYSFALQTTFSGEVRWQDNRSIQFQNGALLPFNTTVSVLNLGMETKWSDPLRFSCRVTGTRTASTTRIDQWLQQSTIFYDPKPDLQLKLSGEYYYTHSGADPDLNYFFADASLRYHCTKRNIDWELDATNILDVRTYKAVTLVANTFTASSYALPGRIILLKIVFTL